LSNATNLLEAAIGDALFLNQPFPAPTQLKVSLFSTAPNEAGLGGAELSGNGYAPVTCNPGTGQWIRNAAQDSSNNTVYHNAVAITFPVATANWLPAGFFGLKNENDQLLFIAPLSLAKTIANGEQAVFLAGELQITIG